MGELSSEMPESNPVPETKRYDGVKGASPRALTASIAFLNEWLQQRPSRPLDRVMETEFRGRRDLNSSERRWIASVVFGTVRHLRRQQLLLQTLELPETAETLCRLWAQSPVDGEPPASFRHTPPLVSDEKLGEAIRALPTKASPKDYLRVSLSFPDFLAEELETLLGEEALAAGESFNRQAPITLRVNTLKITPSRLVPRLPPGIAIPTKHSPVGIELSGRINITDLIGWKEGFFEAQEEASQLVSQFLEVKPGETVVDVGAGAGGKTLALAALMNGRGRLVALDLPSPRLGQLQERARRAGVQNLETLVVHADKSGVWQPDEAAKRRLERLTQKADAVMVDAPCTGSGVIRRSPDTKWRESDLAEFARLQLLLLQQSSDLVKPGGRLLYVTCAFERAQNEAVIAAFLSSSHGREFTAEETLPAAFAPFATGELTAIRTWPQRHGMDAFFAMRLRRRDAR